MPGRYDRGRPLLDSAPEAHPRPRLTLNEYWSMQANDRMLVACALLQHFAQHLSPVRHNLPPTESLPYEFFENAETSRSGRVAYVPESVVIKEGKPHSTPGHIAIWMEDNGEYTYLGKMELNITTDAGVEAFSNTPVTSRFFDGEALIDTKDPAGQEKARLLTECIDAAVGASLPDEE